MLSCCQAACDLTLPLLPSYNTADATGAMNVSVEWGGGPACTAPSGVEPCAPGGEGQLYGAVSLAAHGGGKLEQQPPQKVSQAQTL